MCVLAVRCCSTECVVVASVVVLGSCCSSDVAVLLKVLCGGENGMVMRAKC